MVVGPNTFFNQRRIWWLYRIPVAFAWLGDGGPGKDWRPCCIKKRFACPGVIGLVGPFGGDTICVGRLEPYSSYDSKYI